MLLNYYTFVSTIILLLLALCLALVNSNICITFTTIVIFHQISPGSKGLILQGVVKTFQPLNSHEDHDFQNYFLSLRVHDHL